MADAELHSALLEVLDSANYSAHSLLAAILVASCSDSREAPRAALQAAQNYCYAVATVCSVGNWIVARKALSVTSRVWLLNFSV
jgi:hypothetical protein